MKNLIGICIFSLVLAACESPQESVTTGTSDNPLFNQFNQPVDFSTIQADHVTQATESIMEQTDEHLKKILDFDHAERTFENTMSDLDNLYNNLNTISSNIYLIAYTHTDSVTRNNALESNTILEQYGNKLQLNDSLYQSVKNYADSEEARNLTGPKAKFVKETVEDFERNGFALSKEDRDKLKAINDEISEIGNEFSKNIASYQDHLIVSEEDMEGLPDDYKESRFQEDGSYKIDLSYPSYFPFMKYCKSDQARKELYMKFNNRASDTNLEVLQRLLIKRKEMAELLGYNTYAEYRLEDRMAKNPATVWDFETDLTEKVKSKAQKDYQELLEVKKAIATLEKPAVINTWERGYYNDILLKENYQLDEEKVKEYFSLDDVLSGLFSITQDIFDLEYREVENPSVWYSEVRLFEVFKDGKLKGRFYLDLHPRENKFGHAACFPMITGKETPQGYQVPTASLVCNFPPPTSEKPALLPHRQVITFFHEFGHVLHHLLTTSDLMSQAGFSVARDFVEAPSQIFENWAWDYDALKLFAKHYKSGEVLPQELYDKMLASKNVGSGIGTATQIFYGTIDMTLHDKYDPNSSESTTDVIRRLQNDILLFPYVEGTHMQAAFGHLNGYGASYYGYLWSKVYAEDMFSVFEENGVLDKKTGKRYRDIILASGSTQDELELVKQFLGREPNNKAFLKSLGL